MAKGDRKKIQRFSKGPARTLTGLNQIIDGVNDHTDRIFDLEKAKPLDGEIMIIWDGFARYARIPIELGDFVA